MKDRLAFGDMEHVILTMDPPDHTRLRRLAARAFTPGTVAALEPWMRARATALLDVLDGSGEVDAVAGFAEPLPIAVISRLLGVDDDPRFAAVGEGDARREHAGRSSSGTRAAANGDGGHASRSPSLLAAAVEERRECAAGRRARRARAGRGGR